jgi:hypothetical protein
LDTDNVLERLAVLRKLPLLVDDDMNRICDIIRCPEQCTADVMMVRALQGYVWKVPSVFFKIGAAYFVAGLSISALGQAPPIKTFEIPPWTTVSESLIAASVCPVERLTQHTGFYYRGKSWHTLTLCYLIAGTIIQAAGDRSKEYIEAQTRRGS